MSEFDETTEVSAEVSTPVMQFGVPMLIRSIVIRKVTALVDASSPEMAVVLANSGSYDALMPGETVSNDVHMAVLDATRSVYPIINIDTGDVE